MLIKAKMNKNSTDKREIFSWWLQDIDGIANHPGISVVMYAGVREVTEWDLLKVIYTRWHIKDDSGKLIDPFSVAVSNQEWNLSSCEMWNIFKQEVAKQLESIMNQKSLPSS
jgi:hypothetical protein